MFTNPFSFTRQPIYAPSGMVATSQPLAAEVGVSILKEGGNAVDAAIATAVALTVLEPTQNGIGGDAFALLWDGKKVHGLNSSGRSPALLDRDYLGLKEGDSMPTYGWPGVTVPGAPRSWIEMHRNFGRLPFRQLFKPAIHYARYGYPIGPVVAEYWRRADRIFSQQEGPEFAPWHDTFMPSGFTPKAGQVWRSEAMAQTLEALADSETQDFYQGRIAEQIAQFSKDTGGALRYEDLAAHTSEWVEPISAHYKGHDIWELPPNNQAIATLMALKKLQEIDLPDHWHSPRGIHLQIEAMKLAFADTLAYVGDPEHSKVSPQALLDDAYIAQRRTLIGEQASNPEAGMPENGNTVYLSVVDKDGMMVSFIQSNYMGFGSGVVVPDTGVALHNRGHSFKLETGHPNELKPNKRPYHTIMPGFMTRDGQAVGPFGVMGAFMQPQGHLQVAVNMLNYGINPQTVLDLPRWMWVKGQEIRVEQGMPKEVVLGLLERGHEVTVSPDDTGFGRGQIIWRQPNNVLVGGSDGRADGQAIGY